MNTTMLHLEDLHRTIKRLRGPDGCPWDRKQTPSSLIRYLREETEELVAAISADDIPNICEESGDVAYVLMMIAKTFNETGHFSYGDALHSINSKLIRRHPHVFEKSADLSDRELRKQWEKIKTEEKKEKN